MKSDQARDSMIARAISDLPNSWIWTTIGTVAKVASGGTPSTSREDYFHGDIPWITPADLSKLEAKYISKGARNISEIGLQNSSALLLPKGTVIFSSRAPIGYVAIAANKLATNQGCKNFLPSDCIFNEYLYYYLKTSKSLAEQHASGTTFLELSARNATKIPIPLPPIPEQHRIVAKIEELFTRLDAGVESLKKVKVLLKRYHQSLLKAAFEGKLTEEWRSKHEGQIEPASMLLQQIEEDRTKKQMRKRKQPTDVNTSDLAKLPPTWARTTIGAITQSMKNGIYKPRQFYSPDGIACLRMYNIQNGSIVWKDIKRMILTSEELNDYKLSAGDILINRVNSRELVGKAATIPTDLETSVYESKNIRLRLFTDFVESKYVSYWFQIFGQPYFNRNAQQTVGMASINQEQLSAMPVPLPPLAEQREIVEQIEVCFSKARETENTATQSMLLVGRLKTSILQEAFCGQLVPQDPNDGNASTLLNGIKSAEARQEPEASNSKMRRSKQIGLEHYD